MAQVTVYHYTSSDGAKAIDDSKVLLGSSTHGPDAKFGEGVYVNGLSPEEFKEEVIIANNYDGKNLEKAIERYRHKVQSVVVIHVPKGWVEWKAKKRSVGILKPKGKTAKDFDLSLEDVT